MLIRQDFHTQHDLPPKMFLMQVMDDISKAYCFLWDNKNDDHQVQMSWKDLTKLYNKNNFRTTLRKLNNQGLLSYFESEDGVDIELVGWDEIEE